MEEDVLVKAIKDNVEMLVREDIDKHINERVENFRRELEYNKERYVGEVMKGISIVHYQQPGEFTMNYKVTFENVVRLER